MEKNWKDIFGHEGNWSAWDVIEAADNSNISIPDWLHTAFIEMYPDDKESQIDFDKLSEQVWSDFRDDVRRRVDGMTFTDEQMNFIFADWPEGDEHYLWLRTAGRDVIESWGNACGWARK